MDPSAVSSRKAKKSSDHPPPVFQHIPLERFKTIEPDHGAMKTSLAYRITRQQQVQQHLTIHAFDHHAKSVFSRLNDLGVLKDGGKSGPSQSLLNAVPEDVPRSIQTLPVGGDPRQFHSNNRITDRISEETIDRPSSRASSTLLDLFQPLDKNEKESTNVARPIAVDDEIPVDPACASPNSDKSDATVPSVSIESMSNSVSDKSDNENRGETSSRQSRRKTRLSDTPKLLRYAPSI
jgi:hypothetical protein